MVPDSVLFDKKLTGETVRVYAYLAGKARKGVAAVGQRLIAHDLGLSTGTVYEAIKQLEERRHIEVEREGNLRNRYYLYSPIFHK